MAREARAVAAAKPVAAQALATPHAVPADPDPVAPAADPTHRPGAEPVAAPANHRRPAVHLRVVATLRVVPVAVAGALVPQVPAATPNGSRSVHSVETRSRVVRPCVNSSSPAPGMFERST